MSRVEIQKKFDEIVDFAEVEKFLDTPVKRYSSGMYVRLAFAVAAHLEPEILIVDEVLAVGDAQFQKKCLGKMEDVSQNEGRTVLFVSHNFHSLKAICTKGFLLTKGDLSSSGSIEEVLDEYENGLTKIDTESLVFSNENYDVTLQINENQQVYYYKKFIIDIKLHIKIKPIYVVISVAFNYPDGTRCLTLDTDDILFDSNESVKRIIIEKTLLSPVSYTHLP